jgi:hypothetical protein
MNLKTLSLIALGFLTACRKESDEHHGSRADSHSQERLSETGIDASLPRTSSSAADRKLAHARKKLDARYEEMWISVRKDWEKNPALTLERIKQLQYPEFSSADENTKKRIFDMARFAGELSGTPVADRFDCMFRMLPLKSAPGVADDSIRILSKPEVYEAASWLLKLEPSEERTGLLTLICQRMKNLEMTPSEIQE